MAVYSVVVASVTQGETGPEMETIVWSTKVPLVGTSREVAREALRQASRGADDTRTLRVYVSGYQALVLETPKGSRRG